MEHTTIAVHLAKSVFQIAVSHQSGHVDEERRLSPDRVVAFFAQRPPANQRPRSRTRRAPWPLRNRRAARRLRNEGEVYEARDTRLDQYQQEAIAGFGAGA